MTVEKAILSLRNVFEYGQAYGKQCLQINLIDFYFLTVRCKQHLILFLLDIEVALSRVRSLEGLSLDMPLTKEQVRDLCRCIE